MSNCLVHTLSAMEVELHQVREVLRCVLHTILFNRSVGQVKPIDVASELFDVTYVHCGDPTIEQRLEAKINEACGFFEKKPQEVAQEATDQRGVTSSGWYLLCLAFYEPRRRQSGVGWFSKQDERLYWEKCMSIEAGAMDFEVAGGIPAGGNLAAAETDVLAALHPTKDERQVISLCIVQSDVFAQDHHSLAYTNARSVRQAQRQAQLEGLLTEVITLVNEKRSHLPPVVSSSPCSFPWDVSICGGSKLSLGLGTMKRMLLQSSPPAVLG